MNAKINKIQIYDSLITTTKVHNDDYICLTDIAKTKDARAADVIKNWIRSRTTIEFLGTWETINNENFKVVEFDHFRKSAGIGTFVLSPKQWSESTNAIGIISKSGKYGGTYAHKDIAFEFASWVSPKFKLLLIKEFQRLKEIETNKYNLEWDVKRLISKVNYKLQTDAIKDCIIPKVKHGKDFLEYTQEADLVNVVIFGCTAKEWETANPERVLKKENLRDSASINELIVLSNIESMNSILINKGMPRSVRFTELKKIAESQLVSLNTQNQLKSLKKLSQETYINAPKILELKQE